MGGVLVRLHLVGLSAANEVDDVVGTELLFDGLYGGEYAAQFFRGFYLLLWVQTVVALAAVLLRVVLAEVFEQQSAAADGRLGIGCRFLQQVAADLLFRSLLAVHELLQFLQVFMGVEGNAGTVAAVASCASGLLIVALERLRYVVVDDEAHVGFVYAHAEGYGGNDDVELFAEELLLGLVAHRRVESGVVGCRLDVVCLQDFGKLLHLLS